MLRLRAALRIDARSAARQLSRMTPEQLAQKLERWER
jgi:hypothetical protein